MRFELQLKEIELHNFRLFEHVKVAFDDKLTVLISENGAGKTALLEGIAKALTVVTERLAHDNTDLNKGVYDLADIKNETSSCTTEVHLLANTTTEIGWRLHFNRKTAIVKVEQGDNKTYLDDITQQIDAAIDTKQPTNIPIICYYPSNRLDTLLHSNGVTANIPLFKAYDHALDGFSFNFKHLFDWFIWQKDLEQLSNSPIWGIVSRAILQMLNNDADDVLFKRLYIDPSVFNNYQLVLEKGTERVNIHQLSSGEKSLLVLVSDLARRLALANPLSKNPLKEGQGIVLIDEIDLHLHPRWQREVIPKLLSIFPKIQWVVSTHSPFIIGAEHVTPENALIITEDADTHKKIVISVQDLGKQTEGLEPNRILKEIMNVTLRNAETEADIQRLVNLINEEDFDKPETRILFNHLSEQLGKQDSVIVRAAHRLSVLERQKPVST